MLSYQGSEKAGKHRDKTDSIGTVERRFHETSYDMREKKTIIKKTGEKNPNPSTARWLRVKLAKCMHHA